MLICFVLNFRQNLFNQCFVCVCKSIGISIRLIRILNLLCCENRYFILDDSLAIKCNIFNFIGKFFNIDTLKFRFFYISKDVCIRILLIPCFYVCRGNSDCSHSRFWINGFNPIEQNANNFIYLRPVCDSLKLRLFCVCKIVVSMDIIFICNKVMFCVILLDRFKRLFFFEISKPISYTL